ncbi:hypothetical protein [Actinomadura rugatobispora]|uniref:Uncharacterized protein n=1 Tax=Actinomadura rugatobispora TaxID=1994 RepID=A0ABW1A0Y5_9ACTN|nr:hypothetical protein GCM10010200_048850 [Actinomadura rugatobispora]
MAAQVIALRPRPVPASLPVPATRPRSSWASPAVPPVAVGWDAFRSLHLARCEMCADSFASSRADEVDQWADTHRCDLELVALLAEITVRRAA